MTQLIVGDPTAAAGPDKGSSEHEKRRVWAPERAAGEPDAGSSGALARALIAFEAEVTAREPDSVLLCDDSDAALAAALVATKRQIPVAAAPAASRPSTANGRLIEQLAGSYTRPA